jgi:hypothetical protein
VSALLLGSRSIVRSLGLRWALLGGLALAGPATAAPEALQAPGGDGAGRPPERTTEQGVERLKAELAEWAREVTVFDRGHRERGLRVLTFYARVDLTDPAKLQERCERAAEVAREAFPPAHEIEVRLNTPARNAQHACPPVETPRAASSPLRLEPRDCDDVADPVEAAACRKIQLERLKPLNCDVADPAEAAACREIQQLLQQADDAPEPAALLEPSQPARTH